MLALLDLAEPESVGAESVGLDDVRSGVHVGFVDLAHQLRPGDVELVETLGEGDPRRVEHGAHGAIEDSYSGPQEIGELGEGGSGFDHKADHYSRRRTRRPAREKGHDRPGEQC